MSFLGTYFTKNCGTRNTKEIILGICEAIMDTNVSDMNILYKMLDVKCEYCGKPITKEPIRIWIDAKAPATERPAFFCNDECIDTWWMTPVDRIKE